MINIMKKLLSPFVTLRGKHLTKREVDILLVGEKSQMMFYKSREKYFRHCVKQLVKIVVSHEGRQVKIYYEGETMEALGFFKGSDIYKVPNPTGEEIAKTLNAVINEYEMVRYEFSP